jgi:hypothetical protein
MPSPPGTPGTPGGRYLRVDEAGSVMAGSHDFGGRYTWHLEAKKQ